MTPRRIAIVAVVQKDTGYGLGIAEENEPGYTPLPGAFPSWETAAAEAADRNTRLGLSADEAWRIVASSMWRKT